MIERKKLHGNRRSLYVLLTPYCKEMRQRVEQALAQIEQEIWKDISVTAQKEFMETLQQIYNNLSTK